MSAALNRSACIKLFYTVMLVFGFLSYSTNAWSAKKEIPAPSDQTSSIEISENKSKEVFDKSTRAVPTDATDEDVETAAAAATTAPSEDISPEQAEQPAPINKKKKAAAPVPSGEPEFINVSFREKPIFKIFYLDETDLDTTSKRAQLATANLEKAMNANEPLGPDSKLVEVAIKDKELLEVRVRGYKIIELTKKDRVAAGFASTADYQEQLLTELNIFTSKEFKRLQIQKIALQFFLSVFFALMGFVIFHQARMFFNRADLMIEEKRESLKPMILFSETLISAHALGGLFTLFLVIGRVFTYVIIILTSLGAILGQFSITRTAMSHLFSELFSQSLKSFQSLFEALPGVLLALILLFFWNLSLKILDMFLKGVRSGRISWSFLQEHRIAVVQFWATAISCAIFFPLIIASLFGQFNTPIEYIVISAAIVLVASTLPIFISVASGSFVLWQGHLKLGQWIQIGDKQGEVTEISLHKMTLVPEAGGRIHIPMSHLMLKSFSEQRELKAKEFTFKIKRTDSLEQSLKTLEEIFSSHSFETSLTCISLSSEEYHMAMSIPRFPQNLKSSVLSALSQAHDEKKIQLSSDLIEEA